MIHCGHWRHFVASRKSHASTYRELWIDSLHFSNFVELTLLYVSLFKCLDIACGKEPLVADGFHGLVAELVEACDEGRDVLDVAQEDAVSDGERLKLLRAQCREFSYSNYEQNYTLQDDVDGNGIVAKVEYSTLTVTLPKVKKEEMKAAHV